MNTVEVYERKLKNLEGRLKRSTSELTATQQTKTEQKEELTRQLKLAYTQVEDLEDRVIAVAAEQTHNESQLKRNLQTKELRLKELTSENQHLRQSLHAQNDLDSVKGQRDTIDISYSELSDDHPVSQLKSQLNDAKTALTQAQTEALDSRKSIDRIKVEESSRNERLQAEIRDLKKVAEQTLNEKANAEAELATAQAQINGLDQNHHSVYARANDDLEAARSRLAAVEAASSKKQENLLSQLHQAEQEIRELRKLDQEARNALIEKEHEWASFRDTPENELRSQLVEARSELKKVESKRNEGRSSLQSELEDLRAELEDARRARMQVEQTFLSQFQRLELQYQSRVSELKAHFDHQLGLSSIPEEQRSDSPPRLETNLDVPDLAELSAVGRQAQLSSELPIHASGFENIASSKTIPAPASVIAGGPPPPPTDESYVEIESSDVYTSDLDRQEKASSPTPNSRGKISEANKQNFASVKELLSSMNLPFPELDESGVPQELPDESMLEEETIQESQQPGMGSDGFSEKASRALNTSKLPLPSAQKPRKGRIKTLLSKLSGAELESERPAPNAGDGRPRSDRHHVRFQMSFDNGEDYHVARVRDISETGVYLETAEPQPLGAILTLSPLGMKDFDELELRAKVVRSKQYAPHDFGKESPGMGLRFVPMKDKVRKKLLFLVRQLEDREIRQVGQIDPFLGVRIPSKNADGTDGEERMPIRILGGGLRAGEIAYQLVRHNIPIHLSSVEDQSLDGAMQQVQMRFDADVARGMLNRAEAAKRLRLISTSNKNIDISKVQTIIEAVADPLSIKKAVIKQLEKKIPRDCTIITVVSEGHMVTSIADGLRHPNRLCGIHFVSSTENVGLVEVVRGKLTSQHALDQAKNLARGIELKPIVIADEHGLLVHRILGFYFNEAGHLIEDGVSFEAIDEVTKGFGFNKGPLQLMDEFGINFVRKNAEILEAAFGERAKVPPSILSIANSERQGRDSGSGFYQYLDGQMRGIDPQAYLDCGRSEQGSHNALSEDEIRDRLLLTMINEAARSIGDSIIDNPGTLDMAMVMACSFPAFRKGVLHYADALRPTSILDHLEELEEKHGPRFMPALYLRMLAENDALFYQPQ